MKICNKCQVEKSLDQYGKDPRNSTGVTGICNLCKQLANKALREKRIQTQSYTEQKAKACSQCHTVKEPSLFFKDQAMPDGLATVCKECKTAKTYAWREANKDKYNKSAREWGKNNPQKRYGSEIKRRYGCTLEQYNQMLIDQDGKCAVCGTLHNPAEKKGRLYVDHCHSSGKVRALLCGSCNSMLGYSKDDIAILEKAIEYLEKHK